MPEDKTIPGTKIHYSFSRSKRKTLAIEVDRSGKLFVKAPLNMPEERVTGFLILKYDWIEAKLQKTAEGNKNAKKHSDRDYLIEKARRIIPEKVAHFSTLMGVSPAGIRITSAEKRFGSCSYKNSLNFSLWLMDYPEEAIDYVVVHELAHIKEKNHSKKFYELVAKYLPDYKEQELILKNTYWEK